MAIPTSPLSDRVVTVVLYLIRRRSNSRANSIIFVGAPDAGKTAIVSTVRMMVTMWPWPRLRHTF